MEIFGICQLSLVPLRNEPGNQAEMISQLLFGEGFRVLEQKKEWLLVESLSDHLKGWITQGQCVLTKKTLSSDKKSLSVDLVDYVTDPQKRLKAIVLGSELQYLKTLEHQFEGRSTKGKKSKKQITDFGLMYLNSPVLPGGKSPFGIDADGLTHMAYKLAGFPLARKLEQQILTGDTLSFIEEAEAGDLMFFDDEQGNINHVGILLDGYQILHAYEKVRIDKIDQHGIFHLDENRHTHKLRLIKKWI